MHPPDFHTKRTLFTPDPVDAPRVDVQQTAVSCTSRVLVSVAWSPRHRRPPQSPDLSFLGDASPSFFLSFFFFGRQEPLVPAVVPGTLS